MLDKISWQFTASVLDPLLWVDARPLSFRNVASETSETPLQWHSWSVPLLKLTYRTFSSSYSSFRQIEMGVA